MKRPPHLRQQAGGMEIDHEGIEIMNNVTRPSAHSVVSGSPEKSNVTCWFEETFAARGGFERFCEILNLSPGWSRRKWDQVGGVRGFRSVMYVGEVYAIINSLDLDPVDAFIEFSMRLEADMRAEGLHWESRTRTV